MGRIGDIADLVTGLALLGGGYLIYRAVKDVGDIVPEFPTFEWPTFPGWPELPTFEGPGPIPGPAAPGGITPPTWFEWPTFEWPTFPGWPELPGLGGDGGTGGGGGGVRNGTGPIIPEPSPPGPDIPGDYLDAILRGGGGGAYYYRESSTPKVDLTAGLGRIYEISDDLFGFRKAPGLEFGTRRGARRYLRAYRGDIL